MVGFMIEFINLIANESRQEIIKQTFTTTTLPPRKLPVLKTSLSKLLES